MGLNESALDRHVPGADMFPASKVFAVEKLFPFIGLRVSDRPQAEQKKNQSRTNHGRHLKADILHQCTTSY
jgi:hypothetical protein